MKIIVNIEPHFAGNYSLIYDGKYLSLKGRDSRYLVDYFGEGNSSYEEMILVPVIVEIKNVIPRITKVTKEKIEIKLCNTPLKS